ncbi:MAG: hypothetical protein C5B59_10540 [Bacteroidetes bacterium]|nr:MAG: hypothetical protein C5B59_10540 [Bacteroidota bacterium]
MPSSIDMQEHADQLFGQMLKQIGQIISDERKEQYLKYLSCAEAVQKVLMELRSWVNENPFLSESDEIYFFKKIKPLFYSELLYYHKLYKIEIESPKADVEEQLKYLKKKVRRLNAFLYQLREFHFYLKGEESFLDQSCFRRGQPITGAFLNFKNFNPDPIFSTPGCDLTARLLATEKLVEWLGESISDLKRLPAQDLGDETFRINSSLSVAQLACVLRLFHEEKILTHSNQTELLQFFASHFSTSRQEAISGTSLRAKYYNIERSTSDSVKDLLFQMIGRLKKL